MVTEYYDFFRSNSTDDDFASNLKPASDISVDAVMASLYFNLVVCAVLWGSYEVLRRLLPSVYAARRQPEQQFHQQQAASQNGRDGLMMREPSLAAIFEESLLPLNWVGPVFGVSWAQVLKICGLDGYFFLRYIRMCVRITSVSTFWAAVILVPVYVTGNKGALGWYHLSMSNIDSDSWRMWVPVVFMYLLTGFCFFVMKQEYRHFIELRMEFLGMGEKSIHRQQPFSIFVESIPSELRSDRALFDYFNKLFPGKVHSASVLLNLPDLEAMAGKRLRTVHRLEKSIAYFKATGERPTHIMGRNRFICCGIHLGPVDCTWSKRPVVEVEMEGDLPERGSRVDDITYYTRDLADCNREVYLLQQHKTEVAQSGNVSVRATHWFTTMVDYANDAVAQIMEDSLEDNDLISPRLGGQHSINSVPQVEQMKSHYGSFGFQENATSPELEVPSSPDNRRGVSWGNDLAGDDRTARLILDDRLTQVDSAEHAFTAPGGRAKDRGIFRRIAGRLGLDFVVAGVQYLNKQMDVVVESVVGTTMSSCGFVTFLDLASVTSAASAPLTTKPNVLAVSVAPEPRDIRWSSINGDTRLLQRREVVANILLYFGVVLWSFPLAAIQAFATAERLAQIPGMEWILTFNDGTLSAFINGYLPVIALLGLILILPFIFQAIAVGYEKRKTFSDVQRSILGRYFYFQLANIYITVTAGSLWRSLAGIIDRPSSALELLGESLPTMVGYFISLLITKIFAGLPIVVLRVGALSRMVFLKTFFLDNKLSQRELDQMYRPENVMYGWEYPTQLLVIVICFTYACISPVILPFAAAFFMIALVVYKKQLLYVYTPIYESGGALFPSACDRTLFGLICGQCTLLGYTLIRGAYREPMFLVPLPLISIWGMLYFRRHYVQPSTRLSMERALEADRVSDLRAAAEAAEPDPAGMAAEKRRNEFDRDAYRQPVVTVRAMMPLRYRRDVPDAETDQVKEQLATVNRFVFMTDDEALEVRETEEATLDAVKSPVLMAF